MKNSSKPFRWILTTAVGLLLTASGFAFTFILNSRTGLPVKWSSSLAQTGVLPVKIMLGTTSNLSDGTSFNTTVQAAVDQWNARMGSLQIQTTQTAAESATDRNGINELAFADDVFGQAFGDGVLAVTTGYSGGNTRVETDTLFNRARGWDSYRGTLQSKTDIRRVAIHEIGHGLGLDHPDEATPQQNVSAIMNSHISNVDSITEDDTQGIQSLYGPPNVPPNDNFANASVLSFSSGTLTVAGYNTRATRETGEPNHAGNPGGRSVWYRWKANGSGSMILDTKGSYYDTTLAVYTGSAVNSLTEVASNDDIDSGVVQASTVTFSTTDGVTYSIAVDGFNNLANDPGDRAGADNAAFKLNLNLTGVVLVAPAIVTQPASVTVTAGQAVNFSVTASGSEPLSYQWLYNGIAISGATSSSFGINGAQALNAGKYSVKVTNPQGSVTSAEATLTVNAAPTTPTTPTTPSGGGGGGAPSIWFVAVLAALGLSRFRRNRS